jgi:hypothetical protein
VSGPLRADLYAWAAPRDLDAAAAVERLAAWEEAGGDPSVAPFEPSEDVTWFVTELRKDGVDVDAVSDAVPDERRRPVWLMTDRPNPARIVTLRLRPTTDREDLGTIGSLAAKYDLVLFDPRGRSLVMPLAEIAAYASASFWPRGAIQAFVAGSLGAALVVLSWVIGIPVLSWIGILVGGFLVLGAMYTFAVEGRRLWRRRVAGADGGTSTGGGPPAA